MSRASFRSYLRSLLVGEDLSSQEPTNSLPASSSILTTNQRTPLSPGSPDAPTAGSTPLNLCHYDGSHDSNVLLEQTSPTMLKHQSQNILTGEKRVNYSVPFQEVFCKTTDQLDENTLVTKHHSPGCDDSGVFLEEPIASSPETQSRSAANRLQTTLDKLSNTNSPNMRQYSIHEGLDSDADRSDDLGLASSSIDSADDLDGDPLPSTLHPHVPPRVPARQKPPPVPARKSMTLPTDYQKNNRYYSSDITTFEVPNHKKPPLSKSSSSGDDYICDQVDHFSNFAAITLNEKSKNILNQQKNEQSRNNFAMTRSFHEDMMSNQLRDSSQDSKSDFLARTLSSSSAVKKLDAPNGNLAAAYARRNSEQSAGFKWKSEECLRTAAENKWSISGRRYGKSVSVKDRIAMFSEMEASQNLDKREDLQHYSSETNIKSALSNSQNKKPESNVNDNNIINPLKDSKWHSMYSINKKPAEKEVPYIPSNLKPALSIPSLYTTNVTDNISNAYSTLPIKLEVEPPKAIVSTYPETQLTSNKRYNTGLYSLQNLKNTENLLIKKVAGSNLLSIIDSRKQPTQKLKGLVIPDKTYQVNLSKELPTIVSSDVEVVKESRRASLPVAPVVIATSKAMSLPRNKKLECVPAQRQTSLTEPPWKIETTNNSYVVPKYSPAFKKKSLELPGSSLSPTPPSSITSPMSPPPSSPSSICSSNASSTLQQNVFQFSLSHSKPVQPLQPEKALMSPPSSVMPSDVEYEGDNSEDSSHSASPMRGSLRNSKDVKASPEQQKQNPVQYGRPNSFTSTAKTISHQPMMVGDLVKSPIPPGSESPKAKAAVYLSKTEILLKKDEPKQEVLSKNIIPDLLQNELIPSVKKSGDQMLRSEISKSNGYIKNTVINNGTQDISNYGKKNGSLEYSTEYNSSKILSNKDIVRNGNSQISHSYITTDVNNQPDISVGKFRALPISLKESEVRSNKQQLNTRQKKNWGNGRRPHSECDESDDEDSHSTLSHRTEDSRHNTTDDCLSDATTDSFEKPGLISEPPNFQKCNDDNASTEGYLSDASTDVSIRRFANRSFDSNAYSTEDYLSDATAESPDPDWITVKGPADYSRSKNLSKSYVTNQSTTYVTEDDVYQNDKNIDIKDLRPRRLSQQKTVLKAAVEPSGSVQKFKALTEKWEQRSDATSPPPALPPTIAPLPLKKDLKASPMAAAIISSTCISNATGKGKGALPPSLMPRNSSEKKSVQALKTAKERKECVYTVRATENGVDGVVTRKSISSTSTITESTNGWNPYDELMRLDSPSHDSTGSASSSSKNTLKDDDVFESSTPSPPVQHEMNGFDDSKQDIPSKVAVAVCEDGILPKSIQRSCQSSLPPTRTDGLFNNEPRNRRGVDFSSKNNSIPDWSKSSRPSFGSKSTFSVSDIRRSFENENSKEAEKPTPCKKTPVPAARVITPVSVTSVPQQLPAKRPSNPITDSTEFNDDVKAVMEHARNTLHNEGVGSRFNVLTIVLRREGEGGGSVGITLAGGADYEVKEITVHKVIGGSIADRDGRVMKGDRVMFINGKDLRGVSHGEALHILKAPSPKVALVLARDKTGVSLQQNGNAEKEVRSRQEYGHSTITDSDICVVELMKDATGLGFSIEGGKDSPQGDRPLLVKRVFKGGAADKDGQLEEGDEIICVNDQPVSNMTRTEAWNFLKKLPEGPVMLKTRKNCAIA